MQVKFLAKGKQHDLKGVMRCYFGCCYFEFIRSEFRFIFHNVFKQMPNFKHMSNPCKVSGTACMFKNMCINILPYQAIMRVYTDSI